MIPIEILNDKGELIGQQAFNDNLTTVEQISRAILYTIFYAQQELTNAKNKIDVFIMSGQEDAEDMEAISTATETLKKAVYDAVVAFNTVVDKTAVVKFDDGEEDDGGQQLDADVSAGDHQSEEDEETL